MVPSLLQALAHRGFWRPKCVNNTNKCRLDITHIITKQTVHITSPTRPLSVWPGTRHSTVLTCGALSSASGGFVWFGSLSGLIFDCGCRRRSSGSRTLRYSRFGCRFWGGVPRTGSYVLCWYLRTMRDAGIVGEEAIRCHTEVRHKLDQEHVSRGDEGSGQETKWNVQSGQSAMILKCKFFSVTYFGAWSPQYFPMRRESSFSPPLKNAT